MRGIIIKVGGVEFNYYNYLNKNNPIDNHILKLVKKGKLSIGLVVLDE